MRLIDCFSDAMADTLGFVDAIARGENPEFEGVSDAIRGALSERARDFLAGGYSQEQYDFAKYAVLVFIDEKLLNSQWEHKESWAKRLLQTEHFGTVKAGKGFYDRLHTLSPVNPAERDIREVYQYCLILGFQGKYYGLDRAAELEKIKRSNLEFLTGGEDASGGEKVLLFPEAYIPGEKGGGVVRRRNYKAFAIGFPIVLILIFFFILKSRIMEAVESLMTSI